MWELQLKRRRVHCALNEPVKQLRASSEKSPLYTQEPDCTVLCTNITFTFTFMHLADAFIQSDLHCIQVSTFYQLLLSLGIEPMILALLAPCSTS